MRLRPGRKFVVNSEMLHLAMELAAARAAARELERQFREEHPLLQLDMGDFTVDFAGFENFNLNIDGWEVELK